MQQENLYTPDCIRTYTGQYVNVFDPNPDTICIEDIAHALAHQCRFGGHTQNFYSVAEHSCMVAATVPRYLALAGLMHDAAEAYLVDVPRPIKKKLQGYKVIEDNLMVVIAQKFDFFEDLLHPDIKQADEAMLKTEWNYFMLNRVETWSPENAKRCFLELFNNHKR